MIQRFHCLSPRLGRQSSQLGQTCQETKQHTAWTWNAGHDDFKIQISRSYHLSAMSPFRHRLGPISMFIKGGMNGRRKCMSQRVVPEILDTPKGVRGKIHRKKNTDTFQVLTGIKGQSSDKFTGSFVGYTPLNCHIHPLSWVLKALW